MSWNENLTFGIQAVFVLIGLHFILTFKILLKFLLVTFSQEYTTLKNTRILHNFWLSSF